MNRKRNTAKRAKRSKRIAVAQPKTAKQFFAMPVEFQEKWTRVTHVISRMRADGVSLQKTAKDFGVSPRTVLSLGRSALRKRKGGRYSATGKDTLLRVMAIPTSQGVGEISLRDSRQASRLGEYWDAVQKYLTTGNASALANFERKKIKSASGKRVALLTDLRELDRLASAGVLSFESLYAGGR